MRKNLYAVITCCGAAAALPVQTVTAGIVEFTDRPSFDAAVGPTTLEDFNFYQTQEPFHTEPLDVGHFTLSMTNGRNDDPDRNRIDIPPHQFPEFNIDGTTNANIFTREASSLFFTFDTPILAFGADFAAWNDDARRSTIFIDGVELTPPLTNGNVIRFYGFQSDAPFSVVEIRGTRNDGFSADNVSYLFIPGPASLAVLAGLALRNRRRPRRG